MIHAADTKNKTILPGAMIGILGGGQLGRMLALAAQPLGYRVAILDPHHDCPASSVADVVVTGEFGDVKFDLADAIADSLIGIRRLGHQPFDSLRHLRKTR